MSITGGIKFFNRNLARSSSVAVVASTGDSTASKAVDGSIYTKWESIGSSDATIETFTFTWTTAQTISRLLLSQINWKKFQIKYDIGGGFVDFAGAVGLDGALGGGIIDVSGFADDTAYFEVTEVTGVLQVQITIDTTQIADAEKSMFRSFISTEVGTVQGFPKVSPSITRNSKTKITLSERAKIQKSFKTLGFTLTMVNYPTESAYRADLTLMETLLDSEETFLVWLCGGRRGEDYFRHTTYGWNLRDVLPMDVSGSWNPTYREGVYIGGVNAALNFIESVP